MIFYLWFEKVAPNIAKKIDDNLPFSHLGDMTKSERYINAEKALKANPQIERVVGHSLGAMAALELQRHYPSLKSRTYGAPVLDFNSINPFYNNENVE
jgi:homoserine acetyltransferase